MVCVRTAKDGHSTPAAVALVVVTVLIGLLWSCGGDKPGIEHVIDEGSSSADESSTEFDETRADHRIGDTVLLRDGESFSDDGVVRFDDVEPFRQVGWMFGATSVDEMSYRVRRNGDWSRWQYLQPYFSDDRLHNAHIVLDEPADALEWSIEPGTVTFAELSFSEEVTARPEIVWARGPGDAMESKPDDVERVHQSIAPDDLVTSRYEWGAIDPAKLCNSVVEPYRMTIHHTYRPSSDGGDAAAQMRQMQSYHINTNGWCDIGYHFVVAQSGEIFQGRSRSDRPGAHVYQQNSGNVGISMIGDYMTSGPPDVQIDSVVDIVQWVHDEHGVELNDTSVKGHREWPGQSTSCPGDVGVGYVDDIIAKAAELTPPGVYDVDIDVFVDGLDDFYVQGTSESVPDGFGGEEFTAEIWVTNESSEPIRQVALDYQFDGVGVAPTHYRIETDHPAYDQQSWQLNDANDHPDNPAATELGEAGTLHLYAFSPQETKRIVVDMTTVDYNIGMGDFSGLRAWIRHIENVYGNQQQFGQSPSTNNTAGGTRLEDDARVDVLSRSEWQFRAGYRDDLEGWRGGGAHSQLMLNTEDGLLTQRIEGTDAYLDSPVWSRIDADRYDEMVLQVRSHDGEHPKAVFWSDGENLFDEQRRVRFEAHGDSTLNEYVVPLGEHPHWSGEIEQLRLMLLAGSVEEGESGWYGLDHLYFQNRSEGTTSSATLGVADVPPVDISVGGGDERDEGEPDEGFDGSDDTGGGFSAEPQTVDVNQGFADGCNTAGGVTSPMGSMLLVLLALMGASAVRTRRATVLRTARPRGRDSRTGCRDRTTAA